MISSPQCMYCVHFRGANDRYDLVCDAFPERIPETITENVHLHTYPYPGDHGIRMETNDPRYQAAIDEGRNSYPLGYVSPEAAHLNPGILVQPVDQWPLQSVRGLVEKAARVAEHATDPPGRPAEEVLRMLPPEEEFDDEDEEEDE